jgi:hypothetical protein
MKRIDDQNAACVVDVHQNDSKEAEKKENSRIPVKRMVRGIGHMPVFCYGGRGGIRAQNRHFLRQICRFS